MPREALHDPRTHALSQLPRKNKTIVNNDKINNKAQPTTDTSHPHPPSPHHHQVIVLLWWFVTMEQVRGLRCFPLIKKQKQKQNFHFWTYMTWASLPGFLFDLLDIGDSVIGCISSSYTSSGSTQAAGSPPHWEH